jgi:uncharacterized membrane protein
MTMPVFSYKIIKATLDSFSILFIPAYIITSRRTQQKKATRKKTSKAFLKLVVCILLCVLGQVQGYYSAVIIE